MTDSVITRTKEDITVGSFFLYNEIGMGTSLMKVTLVNPTGFTMFDFESNMQVEFDDSVLSADYATIVPVPQENAREQLSGFVTLARGEAERHEQHLKNLRSRIASYEATLSALQT